MRKHGKAMWRPVVLTCLTGAALLGWTVLARAQGQGGGQSFGGGQSGGGGQSFGGGGAGGAGGGGSGVGSFGSNQTGGAFGSGQATGFGQGGILQTGMLQTSTLGGTQGGTQGGRLGGGGMGVTISDSNILGLTYGNPLSGGLANAGGQVTFGQPLYNVQMPQQTGTLGGIGGGTLNRGLGGTARVGTSGLGTGLNNRGINNNNAMTVYNRGNYVTSVVGLPALAAERPQLVPSLNQVLGRASNLPSGNNYQVSTTDNGGMVLRGTLQAGSPEEAARQKMLIEAMVRLQPGVRDLRNELRYDGGELPRPRPVP